MTQQELADQTGVSQPAISQLEKGSLSMDIAWMRSFARVLSCAPADLLDDDDNPDRLNDHERLLIERYRAADDNRRDDLERVAQALVPMADNDDLRHALG